MRRPREEREGLGTFSGALRHRDAAQGRTAFSGAGRTLGGSAKTEEVFKYDYLLFSGTPKSLFSKLLRQSSVSNVREFSGYNSSNKHLF